MALLILIIIWVLADMEKYSENVITFIHFLGLKNYYE